MKRSCVSGYRFGVYRNVRTYVRPSGVEEKGRSRAYVHVGCHGDDGCIRVGRVGTV